MSFCDLRAARRYPSSLRALSILLWVLLAGPALHAQTPTTELFVENHSDFPRLEWMKASVPFAKGTQREPIQLNLSGNPTGWRVLQRWPDNSVKIAQAQMLVVLRGKEKRRFSVLPGRIDLPTFRIHPAVARSLPTAAIATTVQDSFGTTYMSGYQPLQRPGQELLEANRSTIVLRSRDYHRAPAKRGIGRDFLSQTTYLQIYSGLPFATLDIIVSNDYLGADKPKSSDPNLYPLGDVAFKEIGFWSYGCESLVRHPGKNHVGPHMHGVLGKGSTYVRLVKSGYFGDGQGKHWRVVLFFDDPAWSAAERASWQQLVTGFADKTLIPIADWDSWKRTQALGIFGSNTNPHVKLDFEIDRNWLTWNNTSSHFGPFGAWGDHKNTSTTGTPRNGPHTPEAQYAAQAGRSEPILQLEGISWAQQLRPYHLFGLKVGANDDIYLWDGLPYRITGGRVVSAENLGRRALHLSDPYKAWRQGVPLSYHHDFGAYDVEHFSVDHLFDYYTFTGDHLSLEEIRHLGECLMGATRTFKYFSGLTVLTARAEGWVMQGPGQVLRRDGRLALQGPRAVAPAQGHRAAAQESPREQGADVPGLTQRDGLPAAAQVLHALAALGGRLRLHGGVSLLRRHAGSAGRPRRARHGPLLVGLQLSRPQVRLRAEGAALLHAGRVQRPTGAGQRLGQ